ncbi:MAG: 16S rRNA (adenine(1518)-N(6)/adenine(1519)-N(6))-dimethyltransferase RsmA [Candidatus Omnitrophota bacterium]|jgi:16S rRNA (adenine1518-N6/adenine1519-N6)-dimethyltransferase
MRIKSKKSLGQNFLVDQNIRNKIINSLELKESDIIFEIGSGRGELTALIAPRVSRVYALEIDKRLLEILSESLAGCKNTEIINQDVLKFDLDGFVKDRRIKSKIKVFGNIPYYISSPIIEHLLGFCKHIGEIFLTVQKEFGARVAASPGSKDYGSFSCFTQYYALPKILFDISKNCFRPSPKVDSSFLKLEIRNHPAVNVASEALFFKIVRSGFGKRRKILRNSLLGIVDPQVLDKFFSEISLDRNIRPERLTLENFAFLANLQFSIKKA